MPTIKRAIQEKVENVLFQGKIVIIYGARRVGKTTLVKAIEKKFQKSSLYLNCDEPDIRRALSDKTSTELKSFLGDKKLVIIDEAQRVKDIGLTLKLLVDNFPKIQVMATGSSSFDLSSQVIEPLTGRKYEFHLSPFSLKELKLLYDEREIDRLLEERMIFGFYPEIVINREDKEKRLKEITESYLYKDILKFENIKNSEAIEKLLQALALQIGNEVSYNEIASMVGVDKNTISSYIQILEKAFIVFRLRPFSRNLRNELKKLRKIYFYDLGVRNALINNLNPFALRQDTGALWENFNICERIKNNQNSQIAKNIYFWRTKEKQEIDYLEDEGGRLSAFEFKLAKMKKAPKLFLKTYPGSSYQVINRENYKEFLGI